MKRLILYDLDGTLIDTGEDILAAVNHMLLELGHEPLTRKEVDPLVGNGLHSLIRGCLKIQEPKSVEKGGKIFRDYYRRHLLDHSRLFPGALACLDYFKDRVQGMITNKPDPFAKEMLKALGVARFFSEVIAGDSEFPPKPDPSSVLAMMKKFQAPASDAVMIGDSLMDIEAARKAGISAVVMTHGFTDVTALRGAGPDEIFEGFDEFLEFAKKNNW